MKDIGRNFKRHFDQAWRRFPLFAQKTISKYLKMFPGRVFLCFRMDHDAQNPLGRCAWGERTAITFLAPFFTLTDDEEPRIAVIGHELTHLYRRGSGEWKDDATEEPATLAQAKAWGFEAPGFDGPEHRGGWERLVEEWRTAFAARYGKELESRWIGVSTAPTVI
jgi:hypothetical protein